jgi:hypothetical protein
MLLALLIALALPAAVRSQDCPGDTTIQHFTGGGSTVCPCFVPGEEAGVVFSPPAEWYPIEILRIGVGWGSVFGGSPTQLEQALHIFEGGLPDPGAPVFTLPGPQLNDGFINEFNIEPLTGDKTVNSGPFTVTLQFLNQSSGNPFAASVVHDGNGCQPGKNVVKAIPGGWSDACPLGVTGDWVFTVRIRCSTQTGTTERTLVSAPGLLYTQPNPVTTSAQIAFFLDQREHATVSIYDVRGRRIATIADRPFNAGTQIVHWNARSGDRGTPAGVYFVRLQAGTLASTSKVIVQE